MFYLGHSGCYENNRQKGKAVVTRSVRKLLWNPRFPKDWVVITRYWKVIKFCIHFDCRVNLLLFSNSMQKLLYHLLSQFCPFFFFLQYVEKEKFQVFSSCQSFRSVWNIEDNLFQTPHFRELKIKEQRAYMTETRSQS